MVSALNAAIDQATKILLEAISNATDDTCFASDGKDPNTIKDADSHIALLDLLLRPLHDSILAKSRQWRNRLASIHRLPAELLIHILKMAIDDSPAIGRYRTLSDLRLVCNYWWLLVNRTPSLWTCDDDSYPIAFISAALSRSTRHPLDVTLHHSCGCSGHRGFDSIRTHQRRWGSVTLYLDNVQSCGSCSDHILFSVEVPALHKVHLIGPASASTATRPLFQGQASKLRMLTIKYNVSISWDLATFPPLRSLTLDQITWQAPTFSQFIAFLQGRCRELETLVVRRVSFRDPLTPPQDPALDFPNLVTLSLSDIDKDLASFVVGSVQFHICRFFEIFVEVETIESSSSFFSDCLARASPALGSAASRFSGMEADLGVSPSGYSYDVALGEQYRFTLDVCPDYSNPDSVYQWTPESLARVAPVIPSLPLSVELHDSSCRWLQSDSVLRLEGIKSLHMATTSCEDTRLALERLGQPIVVDGVCRFPFPHLEVLRSGSAAPRDVLKMLINRQSYVVQGCQVEYPKGLKELYVSWEHKPDDEVIRIQEILGEGLRGI